MGESEKLRAARDAFRETYKSQVEEYCFNMSTGIGRVREDPRTDPEDIGKFSLEVRCQFEDFEKDLTDKVRQTIEGIIPKKFEHDGVKYPVQIGYTDIPVKQ